MNIHFIAIGGAAMHNLALALHNMGHRVTGSDDEIFEPSRGRLKRHGLLPKKMGWNQENITTDIDVVILGMHARVDNPELLRAQELGVKVCSYPEFIYEQSVNKQRVVIAGSHGKTTITSMILHVLKELNMEFDYLVGAQIEGFETMVQISDAPIIVLEGDEYLSSPIDRRPKFHWYKPQIALISGIAWDHVNVFPTWENYKEQFSMFMEQLEEGGELIYCSADATLSSMAEKHGQHLNLHPYDTPTHRIENGKTVLEDQGDWPLQIFGEHNLQNLRGAQLVSLQLGISKQQFYEAIASFTGASRRLEEICRNENAVAYKDFAHSPSKLQATVKAVKAQWPDRLLVACMELHTFSSLSKEFLGEYRGTMQAADKAVVFYKNEVIAHKKLQPISPDDVKAAFDRDDLLVFTDTNELQEFLRNEGWNEQNLLLMSSGNFGGMDVDQFAKSLIQDKD